MRAMHAEGRRFAARVQRDRQRDEECEILAVRLAWRRQGERALRDNADVLESISECYGRRER